MNGHVKSVSLPPLMELTATFLSLMLLTAVDSTLTVAVGRSQQCGNSLQLTRLAQKESADLIKAYKASQGEMSELFCKASANYDIPDPEISSLVLSDKIASIYARLQGFLVHLNRVYEQQADLQLPTSPLLAELSRAAGRGRNLALLVGDVHRDLFPNLPLPEAGPTALPPPMNVFQQKVYGCGVLKTYKDFLSNVARELRKMVCRRRTQRTTVLL